MCGDADNLPLVAEHSPSSAARRRRHTPLPFPPCMSEGGTDQHISHDLLIHFPFAIGQLPCAMVHIP